MKSKGQAVDSVSIEFSNVNIPGFDPSTVETIQPLSGGANNRVYKLRLNNGAERVLKRYFRHSGDLRDRLQTEYEAFSFLWGQGVRAIPEAFGCDLVSGYALYQYFDHLPVPSEMLAEDDIGQVLAFVKTLSQLVEAPGAKALSPASEACFSLAELLVVIDRRLRILQSVESKENPLAEALQDFLSSKLLPAYAQAKERAGEMLGKKASETLPEHLRTLSPSDLGFHNALKKKDGRWIFQDFEYFGWDDPAKLIIDFELHPAMNLHRPLRDMWHSGALAIFSKDLDLDERVQALHPLYAIKWCIILLNEFVPDYRARRSFSAITSEDLHGAQLRQLKKAAHMLSSHLPS